MDWKNLKLEDIKLDNIKNKLAGVADKKTLIKFGIGLGSIILFLIIYYSILNPIVKTKQAQIDEMMNKKTEIVEFNKVIKQSKAKIKKLTPEPIQPTSDHSEIGTVCMPEQSRTIDELSIVLVEHNFGISKVNFHCFMASLMNKLPHRFDLG